MYCRFRPDIKGTKQPLFPATAEGVDGYGLRSPAAGRLFTVRMPPRRSIGAALRTEKRVDPDRIGAESQVVHSSGGSGELVEVIFVASVGTGRSCECL